MKLSNARKSIMSPRRPCCEHLAEHHAGTCQIFRSPAEKAAASGQEAKTLHLPITVSVPTADFMQNFLRLQLSKEVYTVDEKEWQELLESFPVRMFNDGRLQWSRVHRVAPVSLD